MPQPFILGFHIERIVEQRNVIQGECAVNQTFVAAHSSESWAQQPIFAAWKLSRSEGPARAARTQSGARAGKKPDRLSISTRSVSCSMTVRSMSSNIARCALLFHTKAHASPAGVG